MAETITMSSEYLIKCDEVDLPKQENVYENHRYVGLSRDIIHFKQVSETVNKYELKNGKTNLYKKEGTSQGELCPLAFVSIPPVVIKREELDHQSVGHSLSHFPEEDIYDSDMTQEIHNKEELDVPSCLEIKLEVKDEMLNDETVGSDYCEDDFVEESGAVVIKSESICDIKEEKPIKTCLDDEKFEDDRSELSVLKIPECEAEKSSFNGDQQDVNEKFILGNQNQLEKDDICVTELINSPNSVEEPRYKNTAIDVTSGFSNSGVDPKIKGNGMKNSYSYICSSCNVVFSSKTLYEQYLLSGTKHMNNELPPKIHSNNDLEEDKPRTIIILRRKLIDIKKKTLNCTQQLQRWSPIGSQRITFSCPICKKPFSEKKIMDFKPSTEKKEKLFPCGMCERSFCLKAIRDRHLRTHSVEERLHCNVCKKSFSIPSKHYKHMQSHCVEKDLESNFSEKISSVKSKLDAHMNSRSGENPFRCSICHKTLSGKEALKVHMRTHTGEKPFLCVICNNSFTTKYGLVVHTQTHTGFKPFACDLCHKSFYAKNSLCAHMRSHSGKQLYKCEVCNKLFSDRSLLKEHMQTHPFKPFPCNLCEKSFSFKAGLDMHMRSHTGEKLHKCEFCNKSFVESSKMRIHRRTHTGEKPYLCDICNKSFSHKSSHKRHVQLHTGENPDV